MAGGLPKDATLRSIRHLLDNPDTFVSSAYGVMVAARRDHGAVVMRLGVTGVGKFPNYRIEDAASGQPLFPVDGANHKPWPDGEKFDSDQNWSEAVMSTEDVRDLLGDIRNFRR